MKKQKFIGGDNNFDSDSDSDSENSLIASSDSDSDPDSVGVGVGVGFQSPRRSLQLIGFRGKWSSDSSSPPQKTFIQVR